MSIATEITRLQNAKSSIKQSIENKGVSVPSDETLSNYNTYIDNITQGEETLDVGGKNPVLIKKYHEEIPFSETNYPNITPTTSNQRMYSGIEKFRQQVDFDNYDYVVKHTTQVKPVYKEEIPSNSSYIIKTIYTGLWDFYKVNKDNYTAVESSSVFIRNLAMYHRANYSDIQYSNSSGIQFAHPNTTIPSGNTTIKVNTNDINMSINAQYMTADAWEKVDAEKSTITFDIKLYQVDKGTTPASVLKKDMVDYVLGE